MKIKYLIVIASFLAFYFFMPKDHENQRIDNTNNQENLSSSISTEKNISDDEHECLKINEFIYCDSQGEFETVSIDKILLKESLSLEEQFIDLSGSLYTEYHYARLAEIINWLNFERNEIISTNNPKLFLISALENLKLKNFDRALEYIDDLKYFVNNYKDSKDEYWLKGCCSYDIDWLKDIKEHDTYNIALILEEIMRNRDTLNESLLNKLKQYDDTPNTIDFIENIQFIVLKAFNMNLYDYLESLQKTDIVVNSFDLYNDNRFYVLSSQIDIINYLKLIELDRLINSIDIKYFTDYHKERNLERIYALMNYMDLCYKFKGDKNEIADLYLRSALKKYQKYDCREIMPDAYLYECDPEWEKCVDNICEINLKFSSRINKEYNNLNNDIELVDYEKIRKKDSLSFFYNVHQLININNFKNSVTIIDGDIWPEINNESKFNSFEGKIVNHSSSIIKKYHSDEGEGIRKSKEFQNNRLLKNGKYRYLHVSNQDLFKIYYHLFRARTGGVNDIRGILNPGDERNRKDEEHKYMLSTYRLLVRSLNNLADAYEYISK